MLNLFLHLICSPFVLVQFVHRFSKHRVNLGQIQKNIQLVSTYVLYNFFNTYYNGDLNTGLVWYSNGSKLFDRRMVCYLNAIWIPDKIKSGIQTAIWIPDRYPNGGLNTKKPFEYQTSEYRTSESLLFRCFCYSDPHCILDHFSPEFYQPQLLNANL